MSDPKTTTVNEATSKRRPVIKLNKAQNAKPGESELLSNLGLIRDILIYESSKTEDPILGGQYKYLKLKNFYNRVTNSSRTFANVTALDGESVVKNSDFVTRAIGQKSYDLVFHALCSVLSNEAKIKAMLALLTVPNKYKDNSTQTENNDLRSARYYDTTDTASQTNILTPLNLLKKKKQYRNKKRLVPYVVTNENDVELENKCIVNEPSVQKIVISPGNFKRLISNDLPVLENVHKDLDQESDSNHSDLSIGTVGSFFDHSVETLLSDINQRIDKPKNIENTVKESEKLDEETEIFDKCEYKLYDGSVVTLPTKPKTVFHIVTRDNLAFLSSEEKRKVIHHQAFVDWKLCLQPNEDGNLPIHLAVLDNDVDFLVRQCVVLRSKNSHVDVFPQRRNLSPLHMAIMRGSNIECVEKLLEFQADPLDALEDEKTAFHRAAEASNPAYIEKLLEHVAKYPRELSQSNESLVTEDIKSVTSEQKEHLISYLYQRISEMCDEEGYTPLMLASKLGRHQNVRLLLEKCSSTINVGMKTSGNTALYLAVEGAGMDALERGDKSKVSDDYLKTIECLLDHNADPGVENFAGSSVPTLLTEFSMNSLSMFMAQKLSSLRDIPQTKKIDEFMLIRESAAASTPRSSDVTQTKEAVVFKKVGKTIEPDRIEVSKEVARPKQTSDSLVDTKSGGSEEAIQGPKNLDPKKLAKKQSKPVILENRRILPEKILAKGSPIAFVEQRSSMINVSLNSQLTVPKKIFNNIKTIKDISFHRDACKRKLLDLKELEEKKIKLNIIHKSM